MMSMLSGQKNTRKKKVAEDLLLLLEAFGQRRLPSTRDLSRIFSVSQSTAMGALRLIAGKGVVELKPCARSRLQGNQPKNERSVWAESSSSQTLYCELVAAISEGIYSTNTTLPKLQFFALKYHMSVNTVRKVYRRLMAEGLVTSQGKRFIVGQLSKVSRVSVRSRPSILIVGRAVNPWRLWSENKRIHDFFEVFGREAQRLNTRLLIVTTKETSRHASIAAAGINAALQLIQELGSDYSGCLILGDRMSIPDLADWAQVLSHHRQPAVWFDRNDEGRQGFVRGLFRCHYSEKNTVTCALNNLAQQNHCRVAFLYTPSVPWQSVRLRLLKEKAASTNPAMEVIGYPRYDTESFQDPFQSGVIALLESIYPHCRGHVKESFDYMIRNSERLSRAYPRFVIERSNESRFGGFCAFAAMNPSHLPGVDPELLYHGGRLWGMLELWPALFRDKATAIICPNDRTAVSYQLRHIDSLGLRVPQELSLLSFDNSHRDLFIPLNTVDPGFGTLAYQVFHTIIGDIRILPNHQRDISTKPQMIDRGSVGPPPALSCF